MIYVLHFDTPLAHAQHYIGCTNRLANRLEAHANGAGSRLTKELNSRAIEWRLGALLTCTRDRMRALERGLKDQKNAARYCHLCTEQPSAFPGTTHYPLEMLAFATDSASLRRAAPHKNVQTVRAVSPDERPETMAAIIAMWKEDRDALGFIPAGGAAGLTLYVARGRLALAFDGSKLLGYAAYCVNPDGTRLTINQCCVADEARLAGIGRALVAFIRDTNDAAHIVAKVRSDLAANHFWQAVGFHVTETKQHKTSGRAIVTYNLNTGKEPK